MCQPVGGKRVGLFVRVGRYMKSKTLLCLLLCLVAPAAMAADPFQRGIDIVPIKLTPALESGLVLESTHMPSAGSWSLRLLADANFSPLSFKLGKERLGSLIPFRSDVHLWATYQPLSRLEIALDLPFVLFQSHNFDALSKEGFASQKTPQAMGVGDIRLLGRMTALTQQQFPLALGAILEVRAPTSKLRNLNGERGFVLAPRAVVERTLGDFRILGNIGWRLHTRPGQFLNLYVGQEFMMGLGLICDLGGGRTFTQNQLLAEFNMVTPAEAPFNLDYADALKTPMELMLGYRARVDRNWLLQAHIGRGFVGKNVGYGREAFRLGLSFGYHPLPDPDRDGDGIVDRLDLCPDEPGPKDNHGCPWPDRDGDGVPDHQDACPDTPGLVEFQGCPDTDGDQIPDHVDECPLEPGPPENAGCPLPPEEEVVVLEATRIRVHGTILFDFDKATLKPESFPLLDEVVALLKLHPEVGPISVEGHTDNVGTRAYNLDLSKRRAQAIVDYLVQQGIESTRLQSAGFGFDVPVASNEDPLGRAKNRRTEFILKGGAEKQEEEE